MIPTTSLRFVARMRPLPEFECGTIGTLEKVLQQWWSTEGQEPPSSHGEWRDVPITNEKGIT